MSTIATPRDPSLNGRRLPQTQTQLSTPTSSSRPSLDNSNSPSTTAPPSNPLRRNRAALREYYNLKTTSSTITSPTALTSPASPTSSLSSSIPESDSHTSTLLNELDAPTFSAPSYLSRILETQSLSELLTTYNAVLTDIRALDAEKKALVYDNYSKLIAATETIRRMRGNMETGGAGAVAGTLEAAVSGIWERAEGIKASLRQQMDKEGMGKIGMDGRGGEIQKRRRSRDVVKSVLEAPDRVRDLVAVGKMENAKQLWEEKLRLLQRWKERGVGGDDVQRCIDEGEAALRGEDR